MLKCRRLCFCYLLWELATIDQLVEKRGRQPSIPILDAAFLHGPVSPGAQKCIVSTLGLLPGWLLTNARSGGCTRSGNELSVNLYLRRLLMSRLFYKNVNARAREMLCLNESIPERASPLLTPVWPAPFLLADAAEGRARQRDHHVAEAYRDLIPLAWEA